MKTGRIAINKYLSSLNPLVINFQIECFHKLCLQEESREIINEIDNNYGMLGTVHTLPHLICIRTSSIVSMHANDCLLPYTQRLRGRSDKQRWWRQMTSFKLN